MPRPPIARPGHAKRADRPWHKQCVGVGIVVAHGAIARLIILLLVKMLVGLRVDDRTEREGLDLALHGETLP